MSFSIIKIFEHQFGRAEANKRRGLDGAGRGGEGRGLLIREKPFLISPRQMPGATDQGGPQVG